jgi:hypothetical protein
MNDIVTNRVPTDDVIFGLFDKFFVPGQVVLPGDFKSSFFSRNQRTSITIRDNQLTGIVDVTNEYIRQLVEIVDARTRQIALMEEDYGYDTNPKIRYMFDKWATIAQVTEYITSIKKYPKVDPGDAIPPPQLGSEGSPSEGSLPEGSIVEGSIESQDTAVYPVQTGVSPVMNGLFVGVFFIGLYFLFEKI